MGATHFHRHVLVSQGQSEHNAIKAERSPITPPRRRKMVSAPAVFVRAVTLAVAVGVCHSSESPSRRRRRNVRLTGDDGGEVFAATRHLLPHDHLHPHGKSGLKTYQGCLGMTEEERAQAWGFHGEVPPCTVVVQGTVVAGDDATTQAGASESGAGGESSVGGEVSYVVDGSSGVESGAGGGASANSGGSSGGGETDNSSGSGSGSDSDRSSYNGEGGGSGTSSGNGETSGSATTSDGDGRYNNYDGEDDGVDEASSAGTSC